MIANQKFSRVHLEVDLDILAANIRAFQEAVHPSQFLAVVKAYGYGSWGNSLNLSIENTIIEEPVIRTCLEMGVKRFAVSRLTEVEALRKLIPKDFEILLLGNFFPEEVEELIRNHATLSISSLEQLILLKEISARLKIPVKVQILIDTGMGRLGIPSPNEDQTKKIITSIVLASNGQVAITGLYSHFANAHIIDDTYTLKQIKKFMKIKEWARQEFSQAKSWEFHIANSWGAGNYRESHLDLVRVGIGLYGVEPEPMKWVKVKSAVTLKSYLIAKRFLPAGHLISYDCRYRLPQDTWVGTVAAGYADGIPLALSSPINHENGVIKNVPFSGQVLIQEQKIPIIGKVTMDYTIVDLNGVNAEPGDEVTFFGRSGHEEIRVRDFADIKGTHGYEILCSLPLLRVPRVYLRDSRRIQ